MLHELVLPLLQSTEGANTDIQVDQKKVVGLLHKTRRFMIYGMLCPHRF